MLKNIEQQSKTHFYLIRQTNQLRAMHTIIRHKNASRQDFIHYSTRINRLVLEEALNLLPFQEEMVQTPVGHIYKGLRFASDICGVSILRAGESMETELRLMIPAIRIGKILIQRDKITKLPRLYYSIFPEDISKRHVILMEPMLATGGSALSAIHLLIEKGVSEDNIVLGTLLAVRQGIDAVLTKYPKVKIVTSSLEEDLNEQCFMLPGIGDFGDRFFGT